MGSGYRVFTAGEVLTASNVQNYLQDQAVMVFGGTAARSSAIGTANFEEGMLTYLTDVDKLQVYTGAAFADVYPAAASTQGLTLISTTSFSGVSSQSINDVFSATYSNYRIVSDLSFATNGALRMRLRVAGADDSNNVYATGYYYRQIGGAGVGNISDGTTTSWALSQSANTAASKLSLDIYNPFGTAITYANFLETTLDGGAGYAFYGGMTFTNTTSFTGFTIYPAASTITGTISVYGYNK